MIVATHRDDERPNLPASLPDVRVIRLHRLPEADTAALTASILGTVSNQPQLLELLHRETEGNACLLVEAMRSLAEEVGTLERSDSMSLAGRSIAGGTRQLIQRRLNRVPKESHALLQAAAAIGRKLELDWVGAIDSEIDVENWLVTCSNAAVLDVQDNRWRFAHDKLREGLRESLPAEAWQQLHNQVAGAMEAIYGDVPEQYSALAYQWGMAENPVREAHFARLAGDDAAHNYANADAVDHYTRAIEATRKSIRGAADQEQLAYLYTQRGRIFQLGGQYEQALKNYTDFGNAAVEFGDRKQELAALLEKITIYVTPTIEFSPDKGRTLLDQALALAHEINDPAAEAKVYWNLLNLSRFGGGSLEELLRYGEKAMALAREHNLKETLAYVLTDISQGYSLSKQYDKGFQCLDEARVLWEELGDKPMLANVLCDNAEVRYLMGDYEAALKLGNEAYALTKSIDNLWGVAYAIMCMVDIYSEQGEIGIAFALIAEGKIVSQQAGFMIAISPCSRSEEHTSELQSPDHLV